MTNGSPLGWEVRDEEALERYLEAARGAADFLWRHNRRQDGRLRRASLAGRASVEANHNDYAYLLEALVTLYDATAEARWLERARALAEVMTARFWDPEAGGFFMSEDGRRHGAGSRRVSRGRAGTLGFQEEPLTVFQATVPIPTTVEVDGAGRPRIARLSLTIQTCDDEKCLKPEDLALELPLPGAQSGTAERSLGGPHPAGVAVAVAATSLAVAGTGWWIWWRPGARS